MIDSIKQFWNYIRERERIRLAKEMGCAWPWTEDSILQKYKFTNVRRSNDKTTKVFAGIYREHRGDAAHVALFNCAVFRYFGTAEFACSLGWSLRPRRTRMINMARERLNRGERVFTGAYVITNCGRTEPKEVVVTDFLLGLWDYAIPITGEMERTRSWEAAYRMMHNIPGFGGKGFMAKEVLQDYLLWRGTKGITDVETWTPVGPGARRGLNRIFKRPVEYVQLEDQFILEVVELRKQVQELWAETFPDAGSLTAHDVQFCLCEFDKYERVRLGQGRPRSTYKRSV